MSKINPEALSAFAAAATYRIYCPGQGRVVEECVVDEDEIVETQDTIENFVDASSDWKERAAPAFIEIAGFKVVVWWSMQARKGDQRGALSVIDFGNVRAVLRTDLTRFGS